MADEKFLPSSVILARFAEGLEAAATRFRAACVAADAEGIAEEWRKVANITGAIEGCFVGLVADALEESEDDLTETDGG